MTLRFKMMKNANGGTWLKRIDPVDHTAPINCIADAERYIRALAHGDKSFHFEDDPATIVDTKSGEPIFTATEAADVSSRVAEMYRLEWGKRECPIGFLLLVDAIAEGSLLDDLDAAFVVVQNIIDGDGGVADIFAMDDPIAKDAASWKRATTEERVASLNEYVKFETNFFNE